MISNVLIFPFFQVEKVLKIDHVKLNIAMVCLGIEMSSDSEYTFLKEFVKATKPIAIAIDNLQGQKQFFGCYLPTLFKTEKDLIDMSAPNTFSFCKPLINALLQGFEKRFKSIMNFNAEESVPAYIAMVTHPKFKLHA